MRASIKALWETEKVKRDTPGITSIPEDLKKYAAILRKADRARNPVKIDAYTEQAYEVLKMALSDDYRLQRYLDRSPPYGVEDYDSLPRLAVMKYRGARYAEIREQVLERYRTYPQEFEPEPENSEVGKSVDPFSFGVGALLSQHRSR